MTLETEQKDKEQVRKPQKEIIKERRITKQKIRNQKIIVIKRKIQNLSLKKKI